MPRRARCATRLPERGRIGVFNRSHYEEVLVVRVHPAVLEDQLRAHPIDGSKFEVVKPGKITVCH